MEPVSPLDSRGASGGKYERGCDQRVRITAPDQILRRRLEHTEHPVMARQIGQIPGHRGVCLSEEVRAIDQGDIVEFCAANAPGLEHPEQAGLVQVQFGLRRQVPQLFRSCCAVSQPWYERPGLRDHCRMGTFIGLRPRGLTHARLLTRRHWYPSLSRSYEARLLPNQAEAAPAGYGRPESGRPGRMRCREGDIATP
ncbi:hypothetical protein ACVWW5_002986 [Bradyrhizobium sp. LM3.4]